MAPEVHGGKSSAPKEPLPNDGLDGGVGGAVVVEILLHGCDEAPSAAGLDLSDPAMGRARPNVEQQAFRFEDTMGFSEGMDHAP